MVVNMNEQEKKMLTYILDKLVEFIGITLGVAVGFIIASGFVARQIAHALGG
ncbi:hypothetical protein [Thermococcus sp.]|uniref:hypothetical protein n=1 Tax=Thermococcus sp. TaxID=35749 RepID=UPI0019C45825|nr:hypothetical protein [Thermococcus sp.]MBC7094662.1 hypothetical protein [Thermococcus sp.]